MDMLKMIPENADVTNLPWITLVTLACGYIGYYIANVGKRDHHKQIDVAFSSLVFGFLSISVYQLAFEHCGSAPLATVSALFTVILTGAFWGRWGVDYLRRALRITKVSLADDVPQAWQAIFTNRAATELSVETKDGTVYLSQGLESFKKLPNGPCVLGASGDILIYATDIKHPGGNWEEQDDLKHNDWGAVITYIPANEVKRVRFRRL